VEAVCRLPPILLVYMVLQDVYFSIYKLSEEAETNVFKVHTIATTKLRSSSFVPANVSSHAEVELKSSALYNDPFLMQIILLTFSYLAYQFKIVQV
jgi:hypothetical protein